MKNQLQGTPLSCNIQIDYTNVGEEHILPFVIELDLENSILDPVSDENQRFCYQITGVGEDIPLYSNLKYLILGIGKEIKEEEIINIAVTMNDLGQPISYGEGGNVLLLTTHNPDPHSDCSGLKFDFELNKSTATMTVCFELTKPYPIGEIPICLFGECFHASGLTIFGPVCHHTFTCPSIVYQSTFVCAPVTTTPFANTGKTTTYCCGDPCITPDTSCCKGVPNGKCHFTIKQNICIAVPIEFGTDACVGTHSVTCGKASTTSICFDHEDTNPCICPDCECDISYQCPDSQCEEDTLSCFEAPPPSPSTKNIFSPQINFRKRL